MDQRTKNELDNYITKGPPDPLFYVMVVDDDADVLKQTCQMLKDCGFRVLPCENAETALNRLFDYEPDLIITDCDMPVMSGLHLTKELRKHTKVPIFMFSSNDSAKDVFLTMAGGNKFFLKTELEKMVVAVIEELEGE